MEYLKLKEMIRKEINLWVGNKDVITKEFIKERTEIFLSNLQQRMELSISEKEKTQLIDSLYNDYVGFGPLQELLNDPYITEIMVNGPNRVYVEKNGRKYKTDVKFESAEHLRYIIDKMLHPTGKRVDESYPYVDFSLKDGSRVNVILPPLAIDGATVTIRKFLRSIEKVEDLVSLGTLDNRMAKFLVACIKAKINIIFSGATGSGKTTTLEVLSSYISPDERIITIEDAPELNLRQDHVVRLLTRSPNIEGKGEVTIRDLFCNTLRMRPSRIILGEIRSGESMDYLQALNSGHKGCLAVIHASSPQDAITRLETLALYSGITLPTWAIRKQIVQGLDLIVQQEQLVDGTRKITYITEVESLEKEEIILKDIFRYEIEEVSEDGAVKGRFLCKGTPSFLNIFKKKGVEISTDIFKEN